ncbi:MAG TPA: CocE/NonD family hydrolase, partial [Candidatus Angelobacter sp.]|nr:CocE/NonD family hydrolase [Candidatus Angelobacter sp.]
SDTGEYFREQIQFPFFETFLKGNGENKLPKAYVFETGTNVWRQYDAWPPKNAEAKTLYLNAGGRLTFDAPALTGEAFDQYVSDPAKPVPFVGYSALAVPQEYMVSDQRFAATRADVLTYETEPLQQDITFAGPVTPKLFVSTSGTDSDWVVKLIDVYPDTYPEPEANRNDGPRKDVGPPVEKMAGYEQLVRGEPMRGKFRKSWEKPEPFVPGKREEVSFEMPDINHTFRRGHRIMVQVQSSWFPLTDLNPQTFVDIPAAKVSDFKPATERVYRSQGAASGIEVLVLPVESR